MSKEVEMDDVIIGGQESVYIDTFTRNAIIRQTQVLSSIVIAPSVLVEPPQVIPEIDTFSADDDLVSLRGYS